MSFESETVQNGIANENIRTAVATVECNNVDRARMKDAYTRIETGGPILKALEDLCQEELEATESFLEEERKLSMQNCTSLASKKLSCCDHSSKNGISYLNRERHSTMGTMTGSDLSDLTDDDLSDDDENDDDCNDANSDCKTIDGESNNKSCIIEFVWEKDKATNQTTWGTIIPNDIIHHEQFLTTCTKLCNVDLVSSGTIEQHLGKTILISVFK